MFYDIFDKLCTEKKVSKNKAVLDMGLSNATPTKWKKSGATPSGDTLFLVADYFGVSVDYLRTGDESKKAPSTNGEGVTEDDIRLALFKGSDEVTEEMWEEALLAVELIEQRHNRKKSQENEKPLSDSKGK